MQSFERSRAERTRTSAAALEQLREALGEDAGGVHVAARDGLVVLEGQVASALQRAAAREAVHQIEGVKDVVEALGVARARRASDRDVAIAAAVRRALATGLRRDAERIHATVRDGVVTLEGQAAEDEARGRAADVVERVRGVKRVRNAVTVGRDGRTAVGARRAIRDALARHAARAARHVNVAVDDGVVTLTGSVRSWPEKAAIVGAVVRTSGVLGVDDRIRVEP